MSMASERGRGRGRGGSSDRGGRGSAPKLSEFDRQKHKLDQQIKELSERMKAIQLEERAINPRGKEAERKEIQKKLGELRDQKNTAIAEHGSGSKEAKELRNEESELKKQLDAIRADQDKKYDDIRVKKTERDNIQREVDELYRQKRELILNHEKKTEEEAEKRKEQRDEQAKTKQAEASAEKEERLKQKDEEKEANDPNAAKKFVCKGLIRYLQELAPAAGDGAPHEDAEESSEAKDVPAHDKVDQESNGVMLNKKLRDEEDLFAFGDGHKKKDKGKKAGKVASKSTAVKFPIQIIEDFTFVGVNPPLTKSELAEKLEELRTLLAGYDAK